MTVKTRGHSFYADFRHSGKRYRKDFDTKNEAETWQAATKLALLKGKPIVRTGKSPRTLGEYIAIVHKRRWAGKPGGEGALKNANDIMSILGEDSLVSELNRSAINSVKDELAEWGIEASTVNSKLSALSVQINGRRLCGGRP